MLRDGEAGAAVGPTEPVEELCYGENARRSVSIYTTTRHRIACNLYIQGEKNQIMRLSSLLCELADSRCNLASMRDAKQLLVEELIRRAG